MNYIETTQTYIQNSLLTQKQKQQIFKTLNHPQNKILLKQTIIKLLLDNIQDLISQILNEEYKLNIDLQQQIQNEKYQSTDNYVQIYKIQKQLQKNRKQYNQLIKLQKYLNTQEKTND